MADQTKWEGKLTSEVKGVPADQVWALLADFCNLQKCFPDVENCSKVEGEDGKPGVVRCVRHRSRTGEEEGVIWAKEKLVKIDEKERVLSYELIDSNMGIKSYEAEFKVWEIEGGEKCRIEWSYSSDPIEGLSSEGFDAIRNQALVAMVQKLEADFSASSSV